MIFLDRILSDLKKRSDTDFVDRLNYYYTPLLIVFFGLTLSAKQYVGTPIQCWVPAQFTGAWEQYSEYYCFVKNTYFVPPHEDIPRFGEREKHEIGYYQWVPFILALQAFLFLFPVIVWRMMNWQSGINVGTLVNAAVDVNNVQPEVCEKNTKLVARHIEDSLDIQRRMSSKGRPFSFLFYGKHYGVYVSTLYLFVKILFITNVIGQFFLLNSFLGTKYYFWGLDILRDIMSGHQWEESGHFPRVTMCDFKVRVLGNLHNWTIQCVLQINMFNEKVYLFLWWWFLIVAIFNVVNFVYWFSITLLRSARRDFIFRYLKVYIDMKDDPEEVDLKMIDKFVHHGLRPDGVLILRMIAENAGHIMATGLTGAMWEQYLEHHEKLALKERQQQLKKSPQLPRSLNPVKGSHRAPPTAPKKRPPSMDYPDPGFAEKLVNESDPSGEDRALLQHEQSV